MLTYQEINNGMAEATLDWEDSRKHEVGVALAAVQIDKPLRIVIIRMTLTTNKIEHLKCSLTPRSLSGG